MEKISVLLAMALSIVSLAGCNMIKKADDRSPISSAISQPDSSRTSADAEFNLLKQNLEDILTGTDIQRNPEKYNGKQMEFAGSIVYLEEDSIMVTARNSVIFDALSNTTTEKEGVAYRYFLNKLDEYIESKRAIKIPYVNNRSPRLLIYDDISFKGVVHAKLVGTEVQVSIDTITDMKILSE